MSLSRQYVVAPGYRLQRDRRATALPHKAPRVALLETANHHVRLHSTIFPELLRSGVSRSRRAFMDPCTMPEHGHYWGGSRVNKLGWRPNGYKVTQKSERMRETSDKCGIARQDVSPRLEILASTSQT